MVRYLPLATTLNLRSFYKIVHAKEVVLVRVQVVVRVVVTVVVPEAVHQAVPALQNRIHVPDVVQLVRVVAPEAVRQAVPALPNRLHVPDVVQLVREVLHLLPAPVVVHLAQEDAIQAVPLLVVVGVLRHVLVDAKAHVPVFVAEAAQTHAKQVVEDNATGVVEVHVTNSVP